MVSQLAAAVRSVVERAVAQARLELYWLELRAAGPRWQVIVYIDHPGGVGVDDCARVSRALGEPLDALIDHSYEIEVSSPGIDRLLYTPEHYKRAIGKPVELRLRILREGRQRFTGWLQGLSHQELALQDERGEIFHIPLQDISRAQVIESRYL